MANKYHVPAVERAFRIIERLAIADCPLRLSELSSMLNIPKTSVLMIMTTLEDIGYILKTEDGKYQLSTKLIELGSKGQSLKELAHDYLERLAVDTKLTAHLSAFNHRENLMVDKVSGPGFIQFSTYEGKRQSFHATSSGKAMLAYMSRAQIDSLFSDQRLEVFTPNTIANLESLYTELGKVRENGYAVEDQEEEMGVRCVGVPIFNVSGIVVAAVSVTGILTELTVSSIPAVAIKVRQTADAISRRLGYQY